MNKNKKKIVIVDDDEDLTKLLESSFKAKGFDVVKIASGKKAIQYLDDKHLSTTSLLVLDRILPDMDGIEILKKVKNKVPVLVLSVLSAEQDVLEGLEKGAIDYVSKPFSLPIFMQKALSVMKK